jgi:DNA-binding response OmpR family regulator
MHSLATHPESARATPAVRTIVIIDDDPASLQLVARVASQVPGLRLISAQTGAAGLAAVRGEVPDLVLLDLCLPDIAGEEVLRQMRADPATAAVPVVVISIVSRDEAARRVRGLGVPAVVEKPVDIRELRRLLERGPGAA